MDEFQPPRQTGTMMLTMLLLLCLGLLVVAGWQMSQAAPGQGVAVFLALALLGFLPMPWLAYHLYALQSAVYRLDRNQLVLRWGLRFEQIPITDVEWVRPADLSSGALRPPLHLPGLIVGRRRHPQWGEVEFLASDAQKILFVGSRHGVYAISPVEMRAFLAAVQRVLESGSLVSVPPQSVRPSFVVIQAWHSPWARFCWVSAFLLNLGLLLWTGWLIPSLGQVSLGFLPNRQPAEAVPGEYLLLVPIVSLLLSLIGWLAGLFLYRRAEQRPLAHLLWFGNLISNSCFLVALYFILTIP